MWEWAFFILSTITVTFLILSVIWIVYVLAAWVKEEWL